MGGLIGFELIRELRRLDAPMPLRLFITARQAPQLVEAPPPLHGLPDQEFFEALHHRYGGIPSEALRNPEIRDVFIPLLKADIEMVETYRCRPEEPLDCPISVFGGRLDRIADTDLSAWQQQTRRPVFVQMFHGSHFFMQSAQAQLLKVIGQQSRHLSEGTYEPELRRPNPSTERSASSRISVLRIEREVSSLNELPRLVTGGAENRNYYLSAEVDGSTLEFVLRCPPECIPEWRRDWGLYDLEREFRVLQELPALNIGLATPEVCGLSDTLGVLSFLMDACLAVPLEHDYHPSYPNIVPAYANAVATISNIAAESSSWPKANLMLRTLDNEIAWSEEKSRRFRNEPMRSYSLSWLREHRPPSRPLVMSHGDPNPSNFLTADGRITGVIDWEFTCLTDDSLGGLLRVTWLYRWEELRQLFCQAMHRDVADLTWHIVNSLFRAVYVACNQDRLQHAASLAELIGYSNGL